MRDLESPPGGPRFYFALPRLIARLRGEDAGRAENNGLEANVVGTAVHLIVYLFMVRLFLAGLPPVRQSLLAIPVAIATWLFWLCLFYINSLIIRLLRSVGMLRAMPDRRAQSLLVGVMGTLFAARLIFSGSWMSVIGWLWIAAVSVNLAAAAALAVTHGELHVE